jgi:Exopolysaccharide biosynthesis protein YbjH/Capsule biosynthesis GfcC
MKTTKFPLKFIKHWYKVVILFTVVLTQTSQAQALFRLSDWVDQNNQAEGYALGLMWQTPEELQRQVKEKKEILELLEALHVANKISSKQYTGLKRAMEALQVTGRVKVSGANAKWLEAQPKKNPLIEPNDTVKMPAKPVSVRVMDSNGMVCEVLHKQGLFVNDYVRACIQNPAPWAWVIQPDGRVQKEGVAAWNRQLQNQPAPGAWLWAPHEGGLSEDFHYKWTDWLSYQGVSSETPIENFASYLRQVTPLVEPVGLFDLEGKGLEYRATANNWGNAGLLETPTARMRSEGYFGLGFSRVRPYEQINLMFQPLPGLEVGFRYSSILNRLYSQNVEFSGDQTLKDKSIDLKLRLRRESDGLPEVALGWRDMGGTGLFGSEYLVANKRFGRLDYSIGIGWGYLGNRANLGNPLSGVLGQKMDSRQANDVGLGGKFATTTWFHGPIALFGGIEYHSPWNLVFKVEYDGNNYQAEPWDNRLQVKRPVNLGLVYTGWRGTDMSLGYERGNQVSVGFTLYTDFSGLNMPKVTDPKLPPVAVQRPSMAPNWQSTAKDIEKFTQWHVEQIYLKDDKVVVEASQSNNPYPSERLNKAVNIIHRDAPDSVETIEVQHKLASDVLAVETVKRSEWVRSQTEPKRTNEVLPPAQPTYAVNVDRGQPQLEPKGMKYTVDPGADLVQYIGGPDGFLLYQMSAALRVGLTLPQDVKFRGMARYRLFSNYDRFREGSKEEGVGALPRSRTYTREYLLSSRTTLTNMTLSKTARATDNIHWGVYTGYFEEMFAGVGAEALYRQPGSRWALGVDVNQVKQRDFAQDLSFRDYKTSTGHATGYWLTPIEGVQASLSVGKYVAGDKGATIRVTKAFSNGSSMGFWATKTNVPPEVFGEGSFDKGIFWTIPFDAFLTSSSRSVAYFGWRPMTRDGGSKLIRPVNLFDETVWLNPEVNRFNPAHPGNDRVAPDDRVERRY